MLISFAFFLMGQAFLLFTTIFVMHWTVRRIMNASQQVKEEFWRALIVANRLQQLPVEEPVHFDGEWPGEGFCKCPKCITNANVQARNN